jgi:hypothetical protein
MARQWSRRHRIERVKRLGDALQTGGLHARSENGTDASRLDGRYFVGTHGANEDEQWTSLWAYVLARIDTSGGPDACWPWLRGRDQANYGRIWIRRRFFGSFAHRLAFMCSLRRRLLRGEHVLHACDNPPCCNPRHLRVGTMEENIHQAMDTGRRVRNAKITVDVAGAIYDRLIEGGWALGKTPPDGLVPRLMREFGVSHGIVSGITLGNWILAIHRHRAGAQVLSDGTRGLVSRSAEAK